MIATLSEMRTATRRPKGNPCDVAGLNLPAYRLIKKIGQGGMGVVYLAESLPSRRRCAVKVMRTDCCYTPTKARRFQFEIDVLERLSHPSIVRLLDKRRAENGSAYYAMEYVPGRNLERVVAADGPLSSIRVVRILRRICSALREVHALGIAHNDIKPANIIAVEHGGRLDAIKLIDFGLAKRVEIDDRRTTRPDGFAGSPLYAPPESYAGAVDCRGDIYSLGATAFYLLTGQPVFDEAHPIAAIAAHAGREPVSVNQLRRGVDSSLDAIVMMCLNKNPLHRFQTVEELDAALAQTSKRRTQRPLDEPTSRGRSSRNTHAAASLDETHCF